MLLTNETIITALKQIISDLDRSDLNAAQGLVEILEGELGRLLRPIVNPDKGIKPTVERVRLFGRFRVRKTNEHIKACRIAIVGANRHRAFLEAQIALRTWDPVPDDKSAIQDK